MHAIGLVAEGLLDLAVAERVARHLGFDVDPGRRISTNGKVTFDRRVTAFNRAARSAPWFLMRDADQDAGDCPVRLRSELLPRAVQAPGLCLRFAVRTVETWLLADRERFADHFAVPPVRVPLAPESEPKPKDCVVNICRKARTRQVRTAMAPPAGKAGTGPEYGAMLSEYARTVWRPDVARLDAPSLERAMRELEQWPDRWSFPG